MAYMYFRLQSFEEPIRVTRIANIYYFEFTPGYISEENHHAFRELVYVDSGTVQVASARYNGPLEKNQLILHNNMEPHALRCDVPSPPNVVIIGFECDSDALDRMLPGPVELTSDELRLLTGIVKEGRTVFQPPYDSLHLKEMKKQKEIPFGAEQMIRLLLEELLISLMRSGGKEKTEAQRYDADKMAQVRGYLDANYPKRITLDELCFLFHTNKTTLCGHFREAYNTSVLDYLSEKRIREAKTLLREGRYSVSEVAQMVGFRSLAYFSRSFSRLEGMSPTGYRDSIKANFDAS